MSPGIEVHRPGRPAEIEAFTNRVLVHPVSRRLADLLIATPVTPDMVSMASVAAAAAAALGYFALSWPWGPLAGLGGQFVWHVLDGADGDLARRTGRASARGELVDGVCDHVSQLLIYIAFAVILARSAGGWAYVIALAAGLSHFVQANDYETGRKTYRRWVYGATWMRQARAADDRGKVERLLGGLYIALSEAADPGEDRIESAMAYVAEHGAGAEAREKYRTLFAPLVKASGVLDSNTRTLAAFVSMLAGGPLWFFLFEIVILNVAMCVIRNLRRRRGAQFVAELQSWSHQAASAPNCSLANRA